MRHLVLLAAAALTAAPGAAHVGDHVFPIYELPTSLLPDIHDGSLDDWEAAVPGATVDFNDFVSLANVGDSAPIDPDDLAYRFYLGWHSATGRLYLGCERVDDVYVNEFTGPRNADVWQHDGIEFMVDGDHSGGPYDGFDTDARRWTGAAAQQYLALDASPHRNLVFFSGMLDTYKDTEANWVASPPFAEAGGATVGGAPALTVIELYVTPFDDLRVVEPELSVPSRLGAGGIIGFSLSVPDFDTGPGKYRAFHTLAGKSDTWRDAGRFVDGELVGCDLPDCGEPGPPSSVVGAHTWGRIKASLARR